MSRGLLLLLALSTFLGASTIHYQSPMLGAFALEFGADASAAGWVATLTFGGFLAGILFLVPLGDRLDKRRLILAQIGAGESVEGLYPVSSSWRPAYEAWCERTEKS